MNKNILIMLFALVFIACGNKEPKTVTKIGTINLDSITVDTLVLLIDEEDSPKAHIHLSMMYGKGDECKALNNSIVHASLLTPDYMGLLGDNVSVKQAVDSFIVSFANDYRRDYAPLYRGDREHRQSYEVSYNAYSSVLNDREGIVSYIVRSDTYGGGEHSVSSTIVKNIELTSGRILKPEDFFVAGYEQPLTELIIEELCKKEGAASLKELQGNGIFADIEPYATDNFIVGDGDMTFIYVDSEIAPHEKGEITIKLTDSQLNQLLK